MALEVEAKLVLPSCNILGEVEEKVVRLGGSLVFEGVEEDYYMNHPCRDFRSTDEALRIRVRGGHVEVTYKGPKRLVAGSKAREEVSIVVGSGVEAVLRLFERLGFRRVAVVRKRRRCYRVGDVLVLLDDVEGLGCFVEVEYAGVGGLSEAGRRVEEVIRLLGLEGVQRTTRSYLEMLLERGLVCR